VFAVWLLLPIVAALVLTGYGWPRAPLAIAVTWRALVFPHDSIVSRSAGGSEAIFSASTAALVAIGQWAVVAFAFGRLLHARSLRTVAWMAPLTIIAVGVAVLLLIRFVGWTYEADLP
jgi:hypothetical protein